MNSESTFEHPYEWYAKADQKDQQLFREWIKNVLILSIVNLTFRKKDDTIREMKCTLIENKIPTYEKKTERVRKENDSVLSVFDLEKKEWRSFRFDAITDIKFSIGM